MKEDKSSHAYWKATLGLLTKILIVWFLVSFGAGILFVDVLNNIKLGGYPLGCWRRLNSDPPCRSNIDPGRIAEFGISNCG